ncbi:hypothetical protein TNIN_428471 [Trichonephila inaurata madagascariensis]|uniref:Uncharacterized protein n=1 Tax=Trichonephila inaurata madagascariensis TaxID=2747483 RepID=A0A8X6WMV7_9ARAC|nr:hypothetical protein TNIN_428471 [Trichonephila inaurata madagascariensis]
MHEILYNHFQPTTKELVEEEHICLSSPKKVIFRGHKYIEKIVVLYKGCLYWIRFLSRPQSAFNAIGIRLKFLNAIERKILGIVSQRMISLFGLFMTADCQCNIVHITFFPREELDQPPCSLYLPPCNYYVLLLKGKHFKCA